MVRWWPTPTKGLWSRMPLGVSSAQRAPASPFCIRAQPMHATILATVGIGLAGTIYLRAETQMLTLRVQSAAAAEPHGGGAAWRHRRQAGPLRSVPAAGCRARLLDCRAQVRASAQTPHLCCASGAYHAWYSCLAAEVLVRGVALPCPCLSHV